MDIEKLRREVIFTAVTSRGPGGQNVNKVSSAALLRWNVQYSQLFTQEQKTLLLFKLQNRMNSEGEVVIRSDEHRDLPRNKERALEKLAEYIRQGLFRPKKRRATKPTRSSQKKRLEGKTRRGETKLQRRRVTED